MFCQGVLLVLNCCFCVTAADGGAVDDYASLAVYIYKRNELLVGFVLDGWCI